MKRKPKKHCMVLLKRWATEHRARVRSATSVRAADKTAPYSELCISSACAGKRVRAFAKGKHAAAMVYTDKGACHFVRGLAREILPLGMREAAGLAGYSRKRRR